MGIFVSATYLFASCTWWRYGACFEPLIFRWAAFKPTVVFKTNTEHNAAASLLTNFPQVREAWLPVVFFEILNFPFSDLDNRVSGVKQVVLPSLLGL